MDNKALMFAIFGVIEHLTKAELTNISRTLIYNYYQGSEQPTYALKAREVVFRYAQCRSLPQLTDIRQKKRNQLDKLEHLVLRMEYQAALLDGSWPPVEPDIPPGASPEKSSFAEALPMPSPAIKDSSAHRKPRIAAKSPSGEKAKKAVPAKKNSSQGRPSTKKATGRKAFTTQSRKKKPASKAKPDRRKASPGPKSRQRG